MICDYNRMISYIIKTKTYDKNKSTPITGDNNTAKGQSNYIKQNFSK